jgi:hypothetical protein
MEVNGMKKYLLLPILLLLVCVPVVHAQSLDIPIKGYGFSFGNSKNFTGLRFNIVDKEVEQINGLNLSLWNKDNKGDFNGISLGGAVAGGDSVNGIAAGFVGVDAKKIRGIALGGVYVADRQTVSAFLSELSNSMSRFSNPKRAEKSTPLSPLSLGIKMESMSEYSLVGIQMGFLVAAARKGFGILGSTMFTLSNEMSGLQIGTLSHAVEMNGLQIGFMSDTGKMNGIAIGAIFNLTREMNGLQIGLFNYAEELNGIQIGLFSGAKKANGIQIGLFNYIGNNIIGLRILPGINAHFSF